jgi:hypothetical protein
MDDLGSSKRGSLFDWVWSFTDTEETTGQVPPTITCSWRLSIKNIDCDTSTI